MRPHGIYDIAKNETSIHLNASCDISEPACQSVGLWWTEQGVFDYPGATEVLTLYHGGAGNNTNHYIFKEDLQNLSTQLRIKIRIYHYPPYCSKS